MTRINLVCPSTLHRAHLVAEYRELPRIFAQAAAAYARGEIHDDRRNPVTYTLGTGHVRFFYSRLQFLIARQRALVQEMLNRGYRPTFDPDTLSALVEHLPPEWHGDYSPTSEAIAINLARINQRLPKS